MRLSSLRYEYYMATGRGAGLSWDIPEMLERLAPYRRANMTLEERLREAATYLARQYPRPSSNGRYIDELMTKAADEIRGLNLFVGAKISVDRPDEKGEG